MAQPGSTIKHTKEGTESSSFWFALGGKQNYTSKKASQEIVRDPHLFEFSLNKGKFEIEEIYNFSQDDLLTEDVLILDSHAEVFVWVGQSADSKEKQNAFDIGRKYIAMASSLEGLSPSVPLYKVTEGNEPIFFTSYFLWDPAKATAHGNSFQKKVMLLFGGGHANEEKSNGPSHSGPTQRASALAALNSAFSSTSLSPKSGSATRPSRTSPASQRAAAVAALSSVLTAEKKGSPDVSPARGQPTRSLPSDARNPATPMKSEDNAVVEESNKLGEKETKTVEPVTETNGEGSESKPEVDQDENGSECRQSTFTYEQLKAKSDNPVTGIDFNRREAYLSNEEFQSQLGMTKEAFYKLPKWKQDMLKKNADLF